MSKNLTLLKLGGAVITNKEIPESVREDVLFRLVDEIAKAWVKRPGAFILGNGAGSFAHVPAGRYKTMEGFIHEESVIGMAITQDAAARLNRIVVRSLIEAGVPAVSVAPSSFILADHKQGNKWFGDVLINHLERGLLPVVYGDVIADISQGCTIWSTDTVFSFLSRELPVLGYNVKDIIHVTEAGGVWKDLQTKEIFPMITISMRDEVRGSMTDIKGFDVTGGMWHKIQEALSLAELGIQTRIVSGTEQKVVYNTLLGDASFGTVITK